MRGKIFIIFFIVIGFSFGGIFIYDFVTQSPFFFIKKINITGINQVSRQEILNLIGLHRPRNIFDINISKMKKQLAQNPWICKLSLNRSFWILELDINIIEQIPMAIVNVENTAEILINTEGLPFKEYEPGKDSVEKLPIIFGLNLTRFDDKYSFQKPLFNVVMNFFKAVPLVQNIVVNIKVDDLTGILVNVKDIYNLNSPNPDALIRMNLGFDHFKKKLLWAKRIGTYISEIFPKKTICAMDLFDIEKVFVKIKNNE